MKRAQLAPSPLHPAMARGEEIARRSGLSQAEFVEEYLRTNQPVILTDAINHWGALDKWTPSWFAERFPEREVEFKYGNLRLPLKDFIPQVLASSSDKPAPYLTNLPLIESFPELEEDVSPVPSYLEPNWAKRRFLHSGMRHSLNRGAAMEIYIGGPGGSFPILHWDGNSTHAFLMQIHGVKQYWAWPPEDTPYMYPGTPENTSPIQNVEEPDFSTYPLFAQARATTFTLHPGETLFVPSRWWHTAKMLSPSITLSVNTLNRSNWRNFCADITHKARGPALLAKSAYLMAELSRYGVMDAFGL